MPTGTARTADEITESIRTLVDRLAEASKWTDRTWRETVRPTLKDLWKQRTAVTAAAAAAVPATQAVIDDTAVRLGIKRERRHWGSFFLGLLVGAAIGAIVALLTTPKRGSEMRDELGSRAEELTAKAKDEWVPIFQRETNGAGETLPGESVPGEASIEAAATSVQ